MCTVLLAIQLSSESVKKVLVEFGDSKDVFELTCVGIRLPGLPRGQGNHFFSEVNPHPTPAYARMGVGGASL